jgi:D-arabinose 1-dehydrogenase-like Zn-dependent alcohol dehydrogenase
MPSSKGYAAQDKDHSSRPFSFERGDPLQEMQEYCGQHNLTADEEIIPMNKINESFERTSKQDIKYRFVIDMATL